MRKRRSQAETLLIQGTGRSPRVLYVLSVVLVAGITWSHLTPVDVFVRAPGVVRPAGDVIRITTETAGEIVVIHTHEGAIVEPGEVLVRLDTRDQLMRRRTLTHQIGVLEAQLGDIRRKLETLDWIQSAEEERLDAEARSTLQSLYNQDTEFRAGIDAARTRLTQARDDHDTTRSLFEAGLASRVAWTSSRTELRIAESDYTQVASRRPDWSALELLERTRAVTASRFAADREDLSAATYPIEIELAELRLQLDFAEEEELRHTIRSPARGQLALFESIHPGEHLTAGSTIGTLEPLPARRIVEAVLANVNAGDVRPSQSVRLLLGDTQIIDGTVRSISPDVRRGDSNAASYRVVIVPDDGDLRLGLGLEVRFITGTETVLTLLTGRITESFRQLGG
jgi:multidrug efflux pump subunit AcrA (membrane-fusion protein)